MTEFPLITDHLLVWVFGLGLPLLSGVQSRQEMDLVVFTEGVRRRFYLANSFFLALAGSVILLHWWWRERPFDILGFVQPGKISHPFATAVLAGLIIGLYVVDIYYAIRESKRRGDTASALGEGTPFLPHSWREIPAYLLMCLSAGVFEEIIYRGFMMAYFLPELNARTGLPFLSVLAPAAMFSLAHYYQGWVAVGKIFLLSLLLALTYLAAGNIWVVMLIHTVIDLAGGVLAIILRSRLTEK